MEREDKLEMETTDVMVVCGSYADMPLSEKVQCLLDALCMVQHVFAESNAKFTHLDHLTQDYLHALELEATSYHERARVATALNQCREERRPFKDNVYLTEPVAAYLKSQEGKKLLGRLEHLRNLAHNTERCALGKKYSPRVLTKAEYQNIGHKLPKSDAVTSEKMTEVPEAITDEQDTLDANI